MQKYLYEDVCHKHTVVGIKLFRTCVQTYVDTYTALMSSTVGRDSNDCGLLVFLELAINKFAK